MVSRETYSDIPARLNNKTGLKESAMDELLQLVNATTSSSAESDRSDVTLRDPLDPLRDLLARHERDDDEYDYMGALLFVVGLLSFYGVAILLLIVSLMRKSRSALEVKDHLRDFEAMRRASQKRSLRLSREESKAARELANHHVPASFTMTREAEQGPGPGGTRGTTTTAVAGPPGEDRDVMKPRAKPVVSYSSLKRAPLVSPVITELRANEGRGVVAL